MSRLVRRSVRNLGFDIRRIDKDALSDDQEYDLVVPRATYSPWNKDSVFKKLYTEIQPLTLVDEYRCFELWKLVEQSAKLDGGDLIEIGVWRGGTATRRHGNGRRAVHSGG